jgi:hypothetical protein
MGYTPDTEVLDERDLKIAEDLKEMDPWVKMQLATDIGGLAANLHLHDPDEIAAQITGAPVKDFEEEISDVFKLGRCVAIPDDDPTDPCDECSIFDTPIEDAFDEAYKDYVVKR